MDEDSEIDSKSRSLPTDLKGNEIDSEGEDNHSDSDDFASEVGGFPNTDASSKTGILALHDEKTGYDRGDQSDTSSQSSCHSAQANPRGGRTQINDSQDSVDVVRLDYIWLKNSRGVPLPHFESTYKTL